MRNCKLVKFNGEKYPYVETSVYIYDKNKETTVKVSTTELNDAIVKCLYSKDPEEKKKAQDFDTDFKVFLNPKDLTLSSEEKFNKLVADYINQD